MTSSFCQEKVLAAGMDVPQTMLPGGNLDATLLRYLRARKWNVEKALDMLKGKRISAGALLRQAIEGSRHCASVHFAAATARRTSLTRSLTRS